MAYHAGLLAGHRKSVSDSNAHDRQARRMTLDRDGIIELIEDIKRAWDLPAFCAPGPS